MDVDDLTSQLKLILINFSSVLKPTKSNLILSQAIHIMRKLQPHIDLKIWTTSLPFVSSVHVLDILFHDVNAKVGEIASSNMFCRLNLSHIHINFCYEYLPKGLVIPFEIIIKLMVHPTINLSVMYYTWVLLHCIAFVDIQRISYKLFLYKMNNINRMHLKRSHRASMPLDRVKVYSCHITKKYITSKT